MRLKLLSFSALFEKGAKAGLGIICFDFLNISSKLKRALCKRGRRKREKHTSTYGVAVEEDVDIIVPWNNSCIAAFSLGCEVGGRE